MGFWPVRIACAPQPSQHANRAQRTLFCMLERVMGIEPTSKAWEAFVLPLNYTRVLAFILQKPLRILK
jgi:hypothetical protein